MNPTPNRIPNQIRFLSLCLFILIFASGSDASMSRLLRTIVDSLDPTHKSHQIMPSQPPNVKVNFITIHVGVDKSSNNTSDEAPVSTVDNSNNSTSGDAPVVGDDKSNNNDSENSHVTGGDNSGNKTTESEDAPVDKSGNNTTNNDPVSGVDKSNNNDNGKDAPVSEVDKSSNITTSEDAPVAKVVKPINNTSEDVPMTEVDKPINNTSGDVSKNVPTPTGELTIENCELPYTTICHDQDITGCIHHSTTDPKYLYLVVQNDGDSTLHVNITISGVNTPSKEIDIPQHKAKKVDILENIGASWSIELNSGHGNCVIEVGSTPPEGKSIFKQFPSYATGVKPIYGVYLLIVTAVIIGVTLAWCKFGKSGRQVDGVPYQELEMGNQESLSSINVETAEGWDQGWDDDWDEENAVKSPARKHVGNVSANGLTSRSTNKDGWENDWDD